MDRVPYQPHIQQHIATVHHSDFEPYSLPVTSSMVSGSSTNQMQQTLPRHCLPRREHQFYPNAKVRSSQSQSHQQQQQQKRFPRHNQALSFDDSHLRCNKKDGTFHSNYPQSEPQQFGTQSSSLRRRRHSSTSRLKSSNFAQTSTKSNSNFIASITNNFMSFGAPFLFDWRLFCERGQPRYVHKHEGDGLRVDECEARFLSKIAEEEKASLNAISDEEDHSSSGKHQQRRSKSGNAVANVECLGSVRKSGFLSVKKWLIRKKTSLELARKRGWKGYWVCLKGTTLLFYRCNCGEDKSGGHVIEAHPRHLIFVDACLVQAIPEHPKRDFVFCLSTAFGDAYLLDAPCLIERDHWIAAIHCACAAQLARSSGRVTVSHVLHKETKRLDEAVDLDTKARTEAEQIISTALAAGSLTAAEAKEKQQQLLSQIHSLEEKIEKNRTEIFRFRAYLAALINEEDPNPKTLLSQTTRRSKMQLNRLGVFNVSSLHAFNCAKNPTIIGNITRSRSTEENLGTNSISTNHDIYVASKSASTSGKEVRVSIVVKMLNGEHHKFDFNATLTADQVLGKLLPAPIARDYYLRCSDDPNLAFKRHETVLDHTNETLEIVPKIMFTCEMTRESHEILFGFSVESELCQDDLRVYVSRVEPNSLAAQQSLRRSDEIVVINGALVQDLDMMYVESVLQEELPLCLTIRAAREEINSSRATSRCTTANLAWSNATGTSERNYSGSELVDIPTTDDLIESLVCPPPPPIDASQMILSEKQLSKYIVPKVDNFLLPPSGEHSERKHNRNSIVGSANLSKYSGQSRSSFTSKSAKGFGARDSEPPERPHSATAIYARGHHHHHHHHRGTHARGQTTATNVNISESGQHHHHHHHHHHHNSTKHIYHYSEPQTHLLDLLEQHLLTNPPATEVSNSGPTATIDANGVTEQVQENVGSNAVASDLITSNFEFASEKINDPVIQQAECVPEMRETVSFDKMALGKTNEVTDLMEVPLENNLPSLRSGINLAMTEQVHTKCSLGSEITDEKLRKVIHELVDTEITYCQSLDQLMALYLDPLLKSCTLTNADARKLIGAIPQVIITQNQFREDLTTIINDDDLNIEGIAKCFLNYCNDFKNYSTFCASHSKAIKLLADEKSILHEWITKQSKSSKNPSMYSLESYLIRPIQRILKYPLLLNQIKTLCPKESQPYFKINEALRAVENVAEHINEMQRINEEYGSIFENLITSTKTSSKKNNLYLFDLNPISLIYYGGVDWINSVEFLAKSFRKNTSSSGGINLHSMCFVFKQCVVFLCKETIRHKSKKQATTSDVEIIKHQVLIPVSEVQVRASAQSEHESDFKWELIQLNTNNQGKRSEKIFRLSNSTNEYRNTFLRTIRQIIREDVRGMSVISARPATTRSETSPTAKKPSEKRHIVSFASTQNLTRCGYCGEDFTKMVKKGS